MRLVWNGVCLLVLYAVFAPSAGAQQPLVVTQTTAAAPEGLHGSAGFGLSLTQGNSDTLNISATVDATYDPKTKNAMRWNALFLRGKQNGVLSVNRISAMFRDENTVSRHVFVFGQVETLHDTFKGIEYLLTPSAGAGFKVIASTRTTLNVDAGIGAFVEKDAGSLANGNGAVTVSEKLVHQLTDTTTLKEAATSFLKTNDFADGLYALQVGVAAKVNSRIQLSIDFLDTFKNHPVDGLTHKHDVALVTSIVAKY
jgi:putative salt-induced outer membrane protein YdiY